MSTVEVTPYSDGLHRNHVVTLWRNVLGYRDAHNNPELSIDRKLAVDDRLFFVAADNGAVVGTVMAGYDGHRGWIYSVAVAPAHRRQGIGSMLVRHAECELIAKGCVKINLQIAEGNERVAEFYAALGYAVEKRVCMGKRIAQNTPVA